MELHQQHIDRVTRRSFFGRSATGLGAAALASLLADESRAEGKGIQPGLPGVPHFAAKAKRVVYLWQGGAPSHVDLFDPKAKLAEYAGKPLPFEQPKLVRTRTVNCLPSPFKFKKHGQAGVDVSELFPNVATCIDDL